MEVILGSKDLVLSLDEKLKGTISLKHFPYQARFFNPQRALPPSDGQPQLIITTHSTPELIKLSEEP